AGFAWLAIGHTADDQAETVLLNLVRGAGLRGLGGMRPVRTHGRVRIVRPLLRIRRRDVAQFVDGEGLTAVADPTNRDPRQRRARARHEVLPILERLAGGPGDAVASLNRLAELARIDTEALDALASEHAARLVVVWGRTRAIRGELLRLLPRALSARILRLMAAAVGGDLSADAVARILALGSGEALHITGSALVSCGGGWLGFAPQGLRPLAREPLIVPGATPLTQLGLDVHVEWPWPLPPSPDPGQLDLGSPEAPAIADVADEPPPGPLADVPPGVGPRARMWAVFGADVGEALVRGDDFVVRARRDGDRLRSSIGMRKLQDLLVDAHVPRVCRDLIPVVVDESDEPLWVPGVAQRMCDMGAPAGIRMWLAPHSGDRSAREESTSDAGSGAPVR
ncbi:MAG TPA: tRNA lysidine(34) synthetase TilS, partial [Euzebyales bacterium]|nr:tRNA lysidine(34) synthetase TilS [Euzebyales bacterium]